MSQAVALSQGSLSSDARMARASHNAGHTLAMFCVSQSCRADGGAPSTVQVCERTRVWRVIPYGAAVSFASHGMRLSHARRCSLCATVSKSCLAARGQLERRAGSAWISREGVVIAGRGCREEARALWDGICGSESASWVAPSCRVIGRRTLTQRRSACGLGACVHKAAAGWA